MNAADARLAIILHTNLHGETREIAAAAPAERRTACPLKLSHAAFIARGNRHERERESREEEIAATTRSSHPALFDSAFVLFENIHIALSENCLGFFDE